MDRYQRVMKPKETTAATEIAENEIRITGMGRSRNYITYAMNLLQEKGSNEVVFKAMGRAINKGVAIVELIKRRIPDLHQTTTTGSTDITDVWEPLEEGLLRVETTRNVSTITIILSKEELNTFSVGYQRPIPIEMVKPLAEIDYDGEEGSPRGRGRRGRGRGRGRGGRGNGYVNVEYDNGGVEPEQSYGRGRGRGRGGRRGGGRGRGGYGGPPPRYEAQQDGREYGYNALPPQDHGYVNVEYDNGGVEPEQSYGRGRGRGRGGRRGGGRGRGGYDGPPPHYEAQQDGREYGYNALPPQDHGYVNVEYENGGVETEQSYGRGRGRGRGGRRGSGGRGRGGYDGPPPHYEAQQDGREYGYNALPPQDHGYDAPPPQGRGRGRGRGGRGRGGGRGGFNRSSGPPGSDRFLSD